MYGAYLLHVCAESYPSRFLLFLTLVFWVPQATFAQDSAPLRAAYGQGVHAFFAGQLLQAEQFFSQVIAAGSEDPRVYYFRSMALLRLGRQAEAEHDMQLGATIEARHPGRQYSVSKSLERVQGTGRRALEKFRRQARLERAQWVRLQEDKRYQQLKQRSPAVLHQDRPVPLESLLNPGVLAPDLQTIPDPQKAVSPNSAADPVPAVTGPEQPTTDQETTSALVDEGLGESPAAAEDVRKNPPAEEDFAAEEDFFGEPFSAADVEESQQESSQPADPEASEEEGTGETEEFDDEDPFADF